MPIAQHADNDAPWGARWQNGQTRFGIWAPAADAVVVETPEGGSGTPMVPRGDGWHTLHSTAFPPGSLYRFALCGVEAPDPAARSQPSGPTEWSEVSDPASYQWSDAEWRGRPWHETVLYELHVGTFSKEGTFLGAIAHLDHLVALGVTVIELMPVATVPGDRNWGYDGVLLFAPQCSYGGPNDLKQLVDACHARGLCVVLDVVFNHFGPAWNLIGLYAPSFFTDRHETPWGAAIDFDGPDSIPVRAFMIQNAVYWVEEFHLDGLRLDAVQAVFDSSQPHILDEVSRRVRAARPGHHIHLMLENDGNQAHWLEQAAAGGPPRYDAQWNDDFHHVMRVLVTGRVDGYYRDYATNPLARLGRALAEGFSYQGEESVHRPGLHRGTPSAHLPPVAFVNFLQNHDQVGNTPFGLRVTDLAPEPAVRLGTAAMLLAPGIPMLFMGQEWGSARPFDFFCDFTEPLAGLVRNGRHGEFTHLPEFSDPAAVARLTDPNAPSTFNDCVLDWDQRSAPGHAAWLAFHQHVLDVRRHRVVPLLPEIGGGAGSFRLVGADGAQGLEVTWRLASGRRLVMALNASDRIVAWDAPAGDTLFRLASDAPAGALPAWDLALVLRSM